VPDPIHHLVHDHGDLNRRILSLGALVEDVNAENQSVLAASLLELQDALFLHFAREEEGLFPFVAGLMPGFAEKVDEMAVSHDAICGSLTRMLHVALSGGDAAVIRSLHERFEKEYTRHSAMEVELLQTLDARLDGEERSRLGSLIDGV
jgi:hypothetical protein